MCGSVSDRRLSLARLDAGQETVDVTQCETRSLAHGVVTDLARTIDERNNSRKIPASQSDRSAAARRVRRGENYLSVALTTPRGRFEEPPQRLEARSSRIRLRVGLDAAWDWQGPDASARRIGRALLFINGENLTDVRPTRWESLLRPARGLDGRWTVDAWAPLDGRNINGGVRLAF
jgi:outer membrane receptor protein involved in Fe transport